MSPKHKRKIRRLKLNFILILLLMIPFTNACSIFQNQLKPHFTRIPKIITMEVTAYCACEKCCGWRLNRNGEAVYAYGPRKGKPKIVGMTAGGTKAKPGVIAADISIYPMGTIMYIEGYGYGRVEDSGSAIIGNHIDLFFKDHESAMNWGKQTMKVKVWLPQ